MKTGTRISTVGGKKKPDGFISKESPSDDHGITGSDIDDIV